MAAPFAAQTTTNQALLEETMRKYNIDHATLTYWEQSLGLTVPTDATGTKLYSPHHITLFKNIKKYMALGRSLQDIRAMITLPPDTQSASATAAGAGPISLTPTKPFGSKPAASLTSGNEAVTQQNIGRGSTGATVAPAYPTSGTITDDTLDAPHVNVAALKAATQTLLRPQVSQPVPVSQPVEQALPVPSISTTTVAPQRAETVANIPLKTSLTLSSATPPPTRIAQAPPVALVTSSSSPSGVGNSQALQLVEKVMEEKDELNRRLVEAEKLNSHLYNVNNLFHRKVKELSALVTKLKANNQEKVNMKLMDDKALLHRQLLETERARLDQQRELDGCYKNINQFQKELMQAQQQLQTSRQAVAASDFLGQWQETASLKEVVYDQFGINLEPTRSRTFGIEHIPTQLVGDSAVIRQRFDYENNALWQRQETLVIGMQNPALLVGELQIDYWLDGAPVCRALYDVTLNRVAAD